MKIKIASLELDFRQFFVLAIPYGIAMYPRLGLKSALISSFLFGILMMVVLGFFRKNDKETSDIGLIKLEAPKFLFFMMAFGFWLFFLLFIFAQLAGQMQPFIFFVFLFFSGLSLYCYFTESKQTLISKDNIVLRKSFLGKVNEERFRISDISTADIGHTGDCC